MARSPWASPTTPRMRSATWFSSSCESVKAASDIYAPVSGEVLEANEALVDAPELLNSDPYGAAWLFKIQPADAGELDQLLDAEGYQASL